MFRTLMKMGTLMSFKYLINLDRDNVDQIKQNDNFLKLFPTVLVKNQYLYR